MANGDYECDLRSKGGTAWPLHFKNMPAFLSWLDHQHNEHGEEFVFHENEHPESSPPAFLVRTSYRCSRWGSGGNKVYIKKHPERKRKRENKRVECACRVSLTIKTYPGRDDVLGRYNGKTHDHPLGAENQQYTGMPRLARESIMAKLYANVEMDTIVRGSHSFFHTHANLLIAA